MYSVMISLPLIMTLFVEPLLIVIAVHYTDQTPLLIYLILSSVR
jgi:hypothetical protein